MDARNHDILIDLVFSLAVASKKIVGAVLHSKPVKDHKTVP